MSNEEKILAMLTKMQIAIEKLQADVEELKLNGNSHPPKKKMTQREVFMGLANLLDDDEKEALGEYMAAEEARKAALYG